MTRLAAIDALLETARQGLDRVQPANLASEIAGGALVVDIRPIEQRHRDGELPGALIIDRNILEWRLDPTCPHHIPDVTDADRRIIIVCNGGYSSSLAAATLRELGLQHSTDLVGGFQAWAMDVGQRRDRPATSRDSRSERAVEGVGGLIASAATVTLTTIR